jgi:hypothetical protein
MQPPTYFDQSKFKKDEPIQLTIKDIESLKKALRRAGISEDTMKNVILTKEENGETHVQISVPIAEIFKSMSEHDNSTSEEGDSTYFTAPIFYNDIPKKESIDEPTLVPKDADSLTNSETPSTTITETTSSTTPDTTTTTATTQTTSTSTTIQTTTSTTTVTTTISTTVTQTTTTTSTTTTVFIPKPVIVTKSAGGDIEIEDLSGDQNGVINLQKLTKLQDDIITPGKGKSLWPPKAFFIKIIWYWFILLS